MYACACVCGYALTYVIVLLYCYIVIPAIVWACAVRMVYITVCTYTPPHTHIHPPIHTRTCTVHHGRPQKLIHLKMQHLQLWELCQHIEVDIPLM